MTTTAELEEIFEPSRPAACFRTGFNPIDGLLPITGGFD